MKNRKGIRLLALVLCWCVQFSMPHTSAWRPLAEEPEATVERIVVPLVTPTAAPEATEALTQASEALRESPAENAAEALFGDANGDGTVELRDLQRLLATGCTLNEARLQFQTRWVEVLPAAPTTPPL